MTKTGRELAPKKFKSISEYAHPGYPKYIRALIAKSAEKAQKRPLEKTSNEFRVFIPVNPKNMGKLSEHPSTRRIDKSR